MIDEPRIALAASPREWAQRLHRHVADHGGARVRATVLQPRDALDEDYDVFVADDTTSFLTPRLVVQLHERGRAVLGVFDPDDPRGRDELLTVGVDAVLPRDAPPQAFVEALRGARASRGRPHPDAVEVPGGAPTPPEPEGPPGRGRTTAVAAASGGAGATEVALALAVACGRAGPAVLVDADDVAPSLAVRLGLPAYPNLRAAVDAVEQGGRHLAGCLLDVDGAGIRALPGLASAAGWSEVRPGQAVDTLRALAADHRQVLVDTGHRIEDLPAAGGPPRHGLARHVLATADTVVAVTLSTPAGVARLLDWVSDLRDMAPGVTLQVVCNRAPAAASRRAELAAEVTGALPAAGLWFVPEDPRVTEAVWRQQAVPPGPFTKAVAALAEISAPPGLRAARRRWRRRAA